jgi:hypothetical protein
MRPPGMTRTPCGIKGDRFDRTRSESEAVGDTSCTGIRFLSAPPKSCEIVQRTNAASPGELRHPGKLFRLGFANAASLRPLA